MAFPFHQNGHSQHNREMLKQYEKLLQVAYPDMDKWLQWHVPNHYDREDILQQAQIKGWVTYHTLQEEEQGVAWLMSILRHQASNHRRQEQRKGSHRKGDEGFDEEIHSGSEGGNWEDRLIATMDLERLKERLRPDEAELLRLTMEGFSNEEIAEELEITVVTVRQRKHRLYKKIKRYMGE